MDIILRTSLSSRPALVKATNVMACSRMHTVDTSGCPCPLSRLSGTVGYTFSHVCCVSSGQELQLRWRLWLR